MLIRFFITQRLIGVPLRTAPTDVRAICAHLSRHTQRWVK
jgi:hypothetical protein